MCQSATVWDPPAKNSLCLGDQYQNENREMVECQLTEVVLHHLPAQTVFWNDTSINCRQIQAELEKVP